MLLTYRRIDDPIELRGANRVRKKLYIIATIIVMLIASRFVVRIVDATVQIDGNIVMLSALLIVVNALIGFISCKVYKATYRK